MLGAGGVCCNIGEVDVAGGDARELDLSLFGGLLEALHSHLVAAEVHALGALELAHEILHHALVKIVAAQTVVAGSCQHLNHAVVNLQDGHIESTAAQVIDHDPLALFLIHAIGQGCGGRLVDDPLHIQAGDLARVLGGLALGVGEICGHGDDRLGDRTAQIRLGVGFQLLQNHGADLLGRIGLAVYCNLMIGAHLPLDGRDGAVRVRNGLTLGHLPHHALAGLGERHHRGRCAVALGVGNDDGLAALHHSHAGVGCTKIDTDNFRHK